MKINELKLFLIIVANNHLHLTSKKHVLGVYTSLVCLIVVHTRINVSPMGIICLSSGSHANTVLPCHRNIVTIACSVDCNMGTVRASTHVHMINVHFHHDPTYLTNQFTKAKCLMFIAHSLAKDDGQERRVAGPCGHTRREGPGAYVTASTFSVKF